MTIEDFIRKNKHSEDVKKAMRQSIVEKGQNVPIDFPFSKYADKIREIDSHVPKVTLTNLLPLANWTVGRTQWIKNNSVHVTGSANNYVGQRIRIKKDHQYYFRNYVDSVAVPHWLAFSISDMTSGGYPAGVMYRVNSYLGKPQYNSHIMKVDTGEEGNNALGFRMIQSSSSAGENEDIRFTELSLLDLTETFGVGNEPSKSVMDKVIEEYGWFDNETEIPESAFMEARRQTTRNANQFLTGLLGG